MTKDITIERNSIDIYDYCRKNGVCVEKIEDNEFIAFPKPYGDKFFFAQETIDFLKFCRENDSMHKYDILANKEVEIRSLHSFDIWMPVIFAVQDVLCPIIVNMISDYIKEKMKGRQKEEAQVDVTLIVQNDDKNMSLHYKGDAKTFKDSFEKIDFNKIWEK